MHGKILVLGATGHVGAPLITHLVAAKQQVKAASRRAEVVAGAEPVRFDYADQTTYNAAFEGVDRVFVMLPGGYTNAMALLQPVIQAAVDRKVKVVLQTAIGVDADHDGVSIHCTRPLRVRVDGGRAQRCTPPGVRYPRRGGDQ